MAGRGEDGEPLKLREKAYDAFKQHLLARDILPGQFVSQRELVELTGLPLGAIRELVPRLEAEGLVERVAVAGDRRAIRVRLTRRGREAFEDMAEEHEVWVDGLLSGLTPRETEEAARLLEKLAAGVMAGRGA
jgi:DNA-binding MarR family transcriptional regulator